MNAPGVATQSYSRYRVLPSRQIMTTVPRCLCVPTTPLDLIHRMLLKMLCRTSNARWRMAALVPNGTHGLSFSAAPTKVPGTAYRLITSRCSSGTSTMLFDVAGVPVIGQVGSTECRVVYPARRNVVDRRIERARGRPPQHRRV